MFIHFQLQVMHGEHIEQSLRPDGLRESGAKLPEEKLGGELQVPKVCASCTRSKFTSYFYITN